MPSLSEYSTQKSIKMLCVGDSGKGKTGALASLAKEGYKLRILDYDNGIGILASLLKGTPALNNIIYESCLDEWQAVGGAVYPKGAPTAFSKGLGLLTNWKTKDVDLGAVSKWGKDTILVIDSLSHMSNAALTFILATNNRSGKQPWQSDWGQAMDMIESVLKILYSDAIKCHVIVNAHIAYDVGLKLDDSGKIIKEGKPFPNALGQKLPPKIGQYFNTMLQCDSIGSRRFIRTVPNGDLGVKCEILGVPKELPIESGLADFFKAAGHKPQA